MSTSIFETATRSKLRYPSSRGELTTEQLWDVPLRSRDGFDLDAVAKVVNRGLRELSEESFVETKRTAAQSTAELRLEVVRHVIDTKLADERAAETRAKNRLEKEKLLAILAEKQDGKLSELSIRELQKRIDALGE